MMHLKKALFYDWALVKRCTNSWEGQSPEQSAGLKNNSEVCYKKKIQDQKKQADHDQSIENSQVNMDNVA